MKQNILFVTLLIAFLGFFVACNFSKTPLQILAINEQRSVIIKGVALSPEYRTEMMEELMNNNSSKQWLLKYIIDNKMLMNDLFDLTVKDSIASQDLMVKTIEMCDGNSDKCRLLMRTMSLYPTVMCYTNKNYCTPKPIY